MGNRHRHDKYTEGLISVIEETSKSLKEGDLERARNNLASLSHEFRLLPADVFMGGRSTLAVLYLNYLSLKLKYEEIISVEPDYLTGLS